MTLAFGSRTYNVSPNGLGSYYLTGPRGARYELARRPNQPEIMYPIQLGGKWPKVSPIFKGYRFTDKDGELRIFRTW
jgi:hypothetical protein